MIVKIKGKNAKYVVYGVDYNFYHKQIEVGIYHQSSGSILKDINDLEVLDNRIPPDWVCEISEDKQVCELYPKEFAEPIDPNKFDYSKIDFNDPAKKEYWESSGPVFSDESTDFWERYHDGCPIAEEIFAKVTKKLKKFHGIKD